MGSALREMLPYAIGLLVAPLPIVAVVVLTGGREGTRKGIIFCVTWWLVSFVVVLALALFAGAPVRPADAAPAWESAIKIILGLVLLVWAIRHFIEMRRGPRHTLRGLEGLGELPPDRLAATAARLLLIDPLRLSMLIAAALELGSHQLSAADDAVPAGMFALIGTLTVILPMFARPSTQWLLRHNDLLVFLTSLGFGAALLVNGLRQL
ncbi:MAG TPA: GAP family protein [Candidatus Limnocylindrales bacterium]|nr:GAP family protein [Candidatus Limnocylindrales bacterium]